jgi:hypothetical protein
MNGGIEKVIFSHEILAYSIGLKNFSIKNFGSFIRQIVTSSFLDSASSL